VPFLLYFFAVAYLSIENTRWNRSFNSWSDGCSSCWPVLATFSRDCCIRVSRRESTEKWTVQIAPPQVVTSAWNTRKNLAEYCGNVN